MHSNQLEINMKLQDKTYISLGEHTFAKCFWSHQWVYSNNNKIQYISYLKMCSILANLWIEKQNDKFAIRRYNEGEFGFGGYQYNMAKGMNRRYNKLTKLIQQF